MPKRNPNMLPNHPTITGTMAPPQIPVTRIPEKAPWCLLTELSAKEMIIDHITDAKKPTNGKAIKVTSPGPKSPQVSEIIAALAK